MSGTSFEMLRCLFVMLGLWRGLSAKTAKNHPPATHPTTKKRCPPSRTMQKEMLTRVGLEPTQISLLAPEASALTADCMLEGAERRGSDCSYLGHLA